MTHRNLLLVLLCTVTAVFTRAGCPNQCYHQGACTRGLCNCYRGYAGADCVHELEHEGSGMPAYSDLKSPSILRILVASAQVLGATLYDDLDVVIPGLTVARQLATQGHNVTLIFCLHERKDLDLRFIWHKALKEEGIVLEVIYYTQHYYLPANLAHSFETYAWLSDFYRHGHPPWDIVYFHDGHGLPYYSALAKHQDIPDCGLRNTLLVMGSQLPLLWLTTKGGGGGLKNVDELEINFIEHESARLVDHVVISSGYFDKWMAERNWKLPWSTFRIPQPLPAKDIERIRAANAIGEEPTHKQQQRERQFVFLIEGPGSGVLGKSVSSGKNQNSAVSREVSEEDEADMDRFAYVMEDTLVACEVATKLAGMLTEEELALTSFTFFLLGADVGTKPRAADQIKFLAGARKWSFTWAVARGSTSQAVEHAAAPGRTVLLQALRFRGGNTPVLLRRVVAAKAAAKATGGGAVIVANADAAEVIGSFIKAAEGQDQPAFVGADTDDIMHRMLELHRGHGFNLESAQDELEVASASATWLNYLPWHTGNIRQEIYSYDGTGGRLFMDVSGADSSVQAPQQVVVDGVRITTKGNEEQLAGSRPKVALKGDALVGEAIGQRVAGGLEGAGSSSDNSRTGWRGDVAERQATRVARWSAQQLGLALENINTTADASKATHRYAQPFPPYDKPLVTVVITHYNRPKLLPLAIRSVAEQTYPHVQLVVVDDGSPNEDVPAKLDELEEHYRFRERGWSLLREPNRYLGGARNRGVREARGKYILFMDDDNVAKPFEVEYFVQAAESTGADILTSFVDFVWGENYPTLPKQLVPMASQNPLPEGLAKDYRRSPSFVFVGGSADVGIFKNCFGDANSFFRKESFWKLGGYTEDRGIGYEDWELYSRAALKGYNLMVMAHSLYWYRFTGGSMQKTTSYSRSRQRALRAYIEALHEKRDAGVSGLRRQQEMSTRDGLQNQHQCSAGEDGQCSV